MKRKLVGLFVVLAIAAGCLPNVVWAATGNDIANAAWNYLGVSRDVYDCSAFTQKVYSDCGISIPRLTYDQANCGTRIYSRDVNDLKPGDIVCFGSSSNSSDITHVGIYVGNNIVLHSSYSKWQIAQDNMSNWITTGWYTPPYQFAVRVVSGASTPPTNVGININAGNRYTPTTISWHADNATNYWVSIRYEDDRWYTSSMNTKNTSWTHQFKPGKYKVHVEAVNDYGRTSYGYIDFTVADVAPFTPTININAGNEKTATTISWYSENATHYYVSIRYEDDRWYTSCMNTTDTSWAHQFKPGKYKVHVEAVNDYGRTSYGYIDFIVTKSSDDKIFTVEKSSTSATVINNSSSPQSAAVVIANYSGGVLQNTSKQQITFTAKETRIFSVSGDYKVFVWDSLEGMKPLAEQ